MQTLLVIGDDLEGVMRLRYEFDTAAPGTFDLLHERTPAGACARLETHRVDAILLDLAATTAMDLRSVEAVLSVAADAPVVVLTRSEDEIAALGAVHAGAQECLVKGEDSPRVLLRVLRHAIERSRLRRELLDARAVEEHRATHDDLTGLPNRALFLDRLALEMEQAQRERRHIGVAFVDLNHFKAVNDRLGHAVGDLLLQHVAHELSNGIRSGDTVARFGGDEFAILLHDVHAHSDVDRVLDMLSVRVESAATPGSLRDARVSLSIGSAVYPTDGDTAEVLLALADAQMYVAKRLHHAQQAWTEMVLADLASEQPPYRREGTTGT